MSDFNLDTNAPAEHHVVLNKQRYQVVGITRSIQRAAAEKQARAKKIREQAEAATNGKLPELNDEAAQLMIETVAMRLKETGDAPPPLTLLTELWEADELEIDRHLVPLVSHLYGEETQPVPPA
jgi:hypothetical protein